MSKVYFNSYFNLSSLRPEAIPAMLIKPCFVISDDNVLNNRHSYHTSIAPIPPQADIFSKSDVNCSLSEYSCSSSVAKSSDEIYSNGTRVSTEHDSKYATDGEYYKSYEYDELAVKETDNILPIETMKYKCLTNSELDNLERRINNNLSQELQTDDRSLGSLDSNIKFFKTTVEKIFDNFYTCMSDFELYKKRFNEILNKSKEGSVDDMEEFIKDMFEHIMSSEHSLAKFNQHSGEIVHELDEPKNYVSSCGDSAAHGTSITELQEAFKNEHYLTDSTEGSNRSKKSEIDERFKIFYVAGDPRVDINLIGRNMLSEINVKALERPTTTELSIASADNLRKVAAKKLELEKHMNHEYGCNVHNASYRDIPVKVSFAKKNIYLNEDFACSAENNECPKSFLAKLCSRLCRKFRRNTAAWSLEISF